MIKRARQPLPAGTAQGPLVEVEARSLPRRCRDDVRPARPREALVLLFRLHVRRLARGTRGRGTGAGRQGLSRLHRRGAGEARPLRPQQHGQPLRARCARSRTGRDSGLVLEVAFEGLQRSTRHKSGVAMRFPRINRIRWDKPAGGGRPDRDPGDGSCERGEKEIHPLNGGPLAGADQDGQTP